MKKFISLLVCCLTAAVVAVTLVGCDDSGDPPARSELIGTYTYQETIGASASDPLRLTHDKNADVSSRRLLFATTSPLTANLSGTRVSYNMDQRLRLKRDFTYVYEYTVILSNPGDWGNKFAALSVAVGGTFTFEKQDGETYKVTLSDPTSGTQSGNGFHIRNAGNIYDWSMHDDVDFVFDYADLSQDKHYEYDKYVKGREVVVDKTEKVLSDDVFYPDLLDYLLTYSTY